MPDFSNVLIQMGAVGLMLAVLLFFAKYLFTYVMDLTKKQNEENKILEAQFRDYLIATAKEYQNIIEKNTVIFEKLLIFLETDLKVFISERNKDIWNQKLEIQNLIKDLKRESKHPP